MKKYKNRNLNWVLLDVYCEDEDCEGDIDLIVEIIKKRDWELFKKIKECSIKKGIIIWDFVYCYFEDNEDYADNIEIIVTETIELTPKYEEYDLNEETFMLIDYVKIYDLSVEYYID